MDAIDAIAASGMVSAATLAALVKMLRRKHLISNEEALEIYEDALMLLEQQQALAPTEMADIYAAAREVIEDQLRG